MQDYGVEKMIHFIVVVYNKRCEDSSSCRSLLLQQGGEFDVTVFDNSVIRFLNVEFCTKNGWNYLGGLENIGLSKAYNRAIKSILERNRKDESEKEENSLICLLDDDSQLPESFAKNIEAEKKRHAKATVLLPIVRCEKRILSPAKDRLFAPFYATKEECLAANAAHIQAINSGMVIEAALFENYRYREDVFLDGVDYAFLRDCRQNGKKIEICPVELSHSFSGFEKPSEEAAKKRFSVFVKDTGVVYRQEKWKKTVLIVKRALRLCKQYHTLSFLSCLFYHR